MSDRLGIALAWAFYLGAVWLLARPLLIFIMAAFIIGGVLVGVVGRLQDQGDELACSWRRDERPRNP